MAWRKTWRFKKNIFGGRVVWGGINFKRMHGDFRKVAKERKSKYIMAASLLL